MGERCSTPFGINGRITLPERPTTWVMRQCSTPFGINGRITTGQHAIIRPDPGAQRLSASTDGSPVLNTDATPLSTSCSTPFGINGRITRHRRQARRGVQVLNAFRHQRTDHLDLASGPKLLIGVLNAFRHQRTDHQWTQGLSRSSTVCSTPFGINGRITHSRRLAGSIPARVLNAFRHQRTDHYRERDGHYRFGACSTPFGINGRITPKVQQPLDAWHLCSTPFGINGRITGRVPVRTTPDPCAQRLSASTDGSPANAWVGATASSGSAQRLSASTDGSPGRTPFPCRRSAACSTPFGINGRITRVLRHVAPG